MSMNNILYYMMVKERSNNERKPRGVIVLGRAPAKLDLKQGGRSRRRRNTVARESKETRSHDNRHTLIFKSKPLALGAASNRYVASNYSSAVFLWSICYEFILFNGN